MSVNSLLPDSNGQCPEATRSHVTSRRIELAPWLQGVGGADAVRHSVMIACPKQSMKTAATSRDRIARASCLPMSSNLRRSDLSKPGLNKPGLRRTMGLSAATSMVVGNIVGAFIFVQPSEVTRLVPSVRGVILAWLISGVLTLCAALVCAELSWLFPETGGVYVFLKRIYSPALAFLWGWGMFWVMHAGILAAIAVVLARYAGYFFGLTDFGIRWLAIAAILFVSFIQYLGVKPGSAVQVTLTAAKLGAIALMCALLFALGATAHHAVPVSTGQPILLRSFGLAVAAGLFAFGGWHMSTYSAGETLNPQRTIPRALIF